MNNEAPIETPDAEWLGIADANICGSYAYEVDGKLHAVVEDFAGDLYFFVGPDYGFLPVGFWGGKLIDL